MPELLNAHVAARLEEVAGILEWQDANPYRVRAYRRAALTLRALRDPVSDLLAAGGLAALEALPGIGGNLARSISALVTTGRLPMLERLRGASDPVALFGSVPGIGRRTAERLHNELGLDTLEELEAAAHDGRLAALLGLGPKRLAGIRDSLAHRLGRVRGAASQEPRPSVGELLAVDREYRDKARAGVLKTIAPRRFNPEGKAWLPVLHATRGLRQYTAVFSNTPRAHRMGATSDWVVVYWDGARGESQATVITSRRGPLEGRRIVSGREEECARWYQDASALTCTPSAAPEPRSATAGTRRGR